MFLEAMRGLVLAALVVLVTTNILGVVLGYKDRNTLIKGGGRGPLWVTYWIVAGQSYDEHQAEFDAYLAEIGTYPLLGKDGPIHKKYQGQ